MRENFLGVFGHVVVDNIFNVPRLPDRNTSIETAGREVVWGGTGANIAVISSCLGVRTALASFVGEDFPKEYERRLREAKVDLHDLNVVKGYSTSQAWIFVASNQDQITVIDQGPMRDASVFELQRHTIESSEIVHVGTGRPEYYQRVVETASSLGKKIAFDPAQELAYIYGPDTFKKIIQYVDFFFANETEIAQALSYLDLKDRNELLEYVDVLIITKGERGSTIITEKEEISTPSIAPTKVEDITGAGDAYRAGFYAGLERNYDLERCGLVGAATASFIIEKKGPQTNIPTWRAIQERIDESLRSS
ncbi:MAG: carbohydrate kinase family protein [Thermoplasmata archaeon]